MNEWKKITKEIRKDFNKLTKEGRRQKLLKIKFITLL